MDILIPGNRLTLFPDASDDTLGGRLSAARDAAGISPDVLAGQLGVPSETLLGWEADRAEPLPTRLLNLAGILGVSPMWLMTGVGIGPDDHDRRLPLEAMRLQLAHLDQLHQECGRLIQSLSRQIERYEEEEKALNCAAKA
ncbi:helix-turn-helix domain-containing protein [Rhizobium cremeum]|uniref:helix-turn-helix domain-containing protein n=1 Tax=Rhizobium cremeum TaxID=2813827 RepID=UPI000DDC034E|nr:helix-turn-helix domain-containing protein [Rhizobium cremeum]MCJ7997911.1 helix-turn-helix domain-containing protein [Rhizobium cremeum]MCJ8003005.1 helix-turn-helix domain-containing protein [Rhizobium cremeum]